MKAGTAQGISNAILSCTAGLASFLFSLTALLYITEFDAKLLAALAAGTFCLLISYIASERPNSESARALAQLEALAGMIYVAVFMARLVSMYSAERTAREVPAPHDDPTMSNREAL